MGSMSEPIFSFACTPDKDIYWANYFLDPAYKKDIGSEHSGIDLNVIQLNDLPYAGADRDLGYPVSNVLPGTVIHAGLMLLDGTTRSSYGRVVKVRTNATYQRWIEDKLRQRYGTSTPWGDFNFPCMDLIYAHLVQECVTVGDMLNSGEAIGSIGKSGRREASYPAHLHFAIQIVDTHNNPVVLPQVGKSPSDIRREFLDPAMLIGRRSGVLKMSDRATAVHPQRETFRF